MTMDNEKENVIAYISLPNMPTVDGAVAVRGDSMYPIIKSGDIVVFKWVSSPEYITYGEMYLISYMWDYDKHVTVKYVKRSQQPGFELGISLEVLEYSIGQSMKKNRPIFNYVRIMRTHADNAMRLILDNLIV
jgi:hypothetical protein